MGNNTPVSLFAHMIEIRTGAQHGRVFDRARNHMFAVRFKLQRRMDRSIIGFCAAAGENNFWRLTPKQRCQVLARKIYTLSSYGREAVSTRRVAVIIGQKRQHFLDRSGIKLCRSVVIEIDDFVICHPDFLLVLLFSLFRIGRRKSMSKSKSKDKDKKTET